jgi:hypothetical protein
MFDLRFRGAVIVWVALVAGVGVPSRKWLEFGDAISERMKLPPHAARSIG